jgi:large subunit ribosomal protein L6e
MVKAKSDAKKAPRFYAAEKIHHKLHRNTKVTAPKTRSSITPGTVLVLLSGRFRGKRVVYLKTLPSGLLLVTGPFKINGVPLRRVDQAYVLATKTKLDISKVAVPEHVNDTYFKRPKKERKQKTEGEFFEEKKEKKALPDSVKQDQKAVDAAVIDAAKHVPHLVDYLHAKFSLRNGEYPHTLKF